VLVPTFRPFTCHCNEGAVPPLIIVAIKVAGLPWQIVVFEVEIDMLTACTVLTAIRILFEITGFPEEHREFEVKLQVTTSPLTGI
jgi:hypothetical protein